MQNETTRHKGKQEVRQTGRQYRRQDLGKADIPSNTKADTLRKPTPTVHCLEKCKIRPPRHKGKQEERQVGRQVGDKLGDKKETSREISWETKERKPREGGHTIQSNTGKQEGRQGETRGRQDLGKVDTPSNTGHMWGQDLGKAGTTSNTGTRVGRQWDTRRLEGGYDPRRRHHPTQAHISGETMGDNEKQDFGKVDHGKHLETMGQWETRGDNRRQE